MASHWSPGPGRPGSRGGPLAPITGRTSTALRPHTTTICSVTGMVPGTGGRPCSRGTGPIATPGVLSAQIKVTDRPVTQQGLSGMTMSIKGPQRQILDKSYYLGLLRSKINELTTETTKLRKEIDNFNHENSVYLSYEKRAEGLAGEIRDLQGQLADYNTLVDKLNTNTEMEEVMNDFRILKGKNDREAESMEVIFTERREREEAIRAIEEAIQRERHVADEVIKALPPVRQEKYAAMAMTNKELLQEQSACQEELEALMTRTEAYEAELDLSQMKQEAVCLQEKLWILEARRDAMMSEDKSLGTPQEERDKLLKQVKGNNQEIASMDRQLGEIREKSQQLNEEIRQLEHNTEEVQGECHQKYKELKRREEEIDQFLEAFQVARAKEIKRSTQTQVNIVSLLEHSSRNVSCLHQVTTVTVNELKYMHEVLLTKEKEVAQSHCTAKGLATESNCLQQDLDKVQQLECKITDELIALKEHIDTMRTELATYNDLDTLKNTAEAKKKRLQGDRVALTQQHESLRQLLQEANQNYESVKTKLKENRTHAQMENLERKWQHLEQNNFVMKDFIASKAEESNYVLVTRNVMHQLRDYNRSLTDVLQNNRC